MFENRKRYRGVGKGEQYLGWNGMRYEDGGVASDLKRGERYNYQCKKLLV
jgi:hypothetical protein